MKKLIILSLLLILAACKVDHEEVASQSESPNESPALPEGFTLEVFD